MTPHDPSDTLRAGRILDCTDPTSPSTARAVRAASEWLAQGGLVAFPTETVYGLGANALDPQAVRRIFEAKGRPGHNPLIVHVADLTQARLLSSDWTPLAEILAQAFWPGPLTLVVRRAPGIPSEVTAGQDTVGIRVPAHPIAQALLRESGMPIAAPSANRSQHISPTRAEHVVRSLGSHAPPVLDGGPCGVGVESTVVDATGTIPVVLRVGGVSAEEIARVAGQVARRTLHLDAGPRASPGQCTRHYAPDAATRIVADALIEWPRRAPSSDLVAVLSHRPPPTALPPGLHWYEVGSDPAGYAVGLYARLHEVDLLAPAEVWIEAVPGDADWEVVADRVGRAAAVGSVVPSKGAPDVV